MPIKKSVGNILAPGQTQTSSGRTVRVSPKLEDAVKQLRTQHTPVTYIPERCDIEYRDEVNALISGFEGLSFNEPSIKRRRREFGGKKVKGGEDTDDEGAQKKERNEGNEIQGDEGNEIQESAKIIKEFVEEQISASDEKESATEEQISASDETKLSALQSAIQTMSKLSDCAFRWLIVNQGDVMAYASNALLVASDALILSYAAQPLGSALGVAFNAAYAMRLILAVGYSTAVHAPEQATRISLYMSELLKSTDLEEIINKLLKEGEVGLKASQELVTFYYNYATDPNFRKRANIQAEINTIVKQTQLTEEETKLLEKLAEATATYINTMEANQQVKETLKMQKEQKTTKKRKAGGKRHRKTKKHHKKSQKKYRKKSHKRYHKKK